MRAVLLALGVVVVALAILLAVMLAVSPPAEQLPAPRVVGEVPREVTA